MAGIVNVSEAASIAFHTVFKLSQSGGRMIRKQELADEMQVSCEHLAKIIQRMARAGILETMRGPKGGCKLKEAAFDMSLLDIFESVEGPYQPLNCLLKTPICSGKCCLLGGLLQRISKELRDTLKATTLRSVAEKINLDHA